VRGILTWHSIDPSGSPISVAPAHFRAQLDWIAESGLLVVSVRDLLTLPADARAIAITFDDGFANFADEAAPLLQARGWPATLFVVTGRVGKDNRWRDITAPGIPVLPLLNWDALGALASSGIAIENHTVTHPHLTALDDRSVTDEITAADDAIASRLGRRPEGIAYPYGAHDARSLIVARAGHRWGVTTEYRCLGSTEDPLALPRLDAWYFRRRAHFTAWGGLRFRSWLWARRQARLARAAIVARAGAGRRSAA
jgi:peptidoglycan/xylan/chitin deacetylase (PgdA/CDA1 family)